MKAPDKIYMPNELLSEEWQRHIEGEDTAYLRKDALLELAKERYKAIENDNQLSIFKQGALYELHRVIAKIESL